MNGSRFDKLFKETEEFERGKKRYETDALCDRAKKKKIRQKKRTEGETIVHKSWKGKYYP